MMQKLNPLFEVLEAEGPLPSARLQAHLGMSQPGVSRLLAGAGSQIVRIGRARNTLYALARPVHGNDFIPLYAIDETGRAAQMANLHGLAGGQFFIETDSDARWLRGEAGNGLYASLPYFLYDLRPQGFMGRQIARRYARLHHFPENPRQWNDDQISYYLLHHGYDAPGNLVVGDEALINFQQQPLKVIANREMHYPSMAEAILSEGQPGSSAGGEHQKFTAYTKENGHVIVKFSPAGRATDAQRWADLLVCEHHALDCMNQAGMAAARTELHTISDRLYLEVIRFDRVGATGRLPMISLAMIDAEFTGTSQQWAQTAQKLHQQGLLSENDVRNCTWNDLFGQWIGNSDRHLGNISATITGDRFTLLPGYDMLPMAYAPERGEIIQRTLNPPVRPMQHEDLWHHSALTAHDFWNRASEDERISSDFRQIAQDNMALIQQTIK